MKKQLSTIFCCLSAFLLLGTESKAQISLLQDYVNTKSAAIGTFKTIAFREGGFSSLYPIPNTNGKEFWTISDRGVNVDCANANLLECRPKYDKLYGFPSYAPKIHRIRLNGDSIQILQTITMKRPSGTTATGVLNPTGFGSKSTEEASMDTVTNCLNFASKQLTKDIWAIDSEGLVVDKEGNFWISEEGGPTIWKLNSNGVVVKRFTPYANLAGAQPEDVQIDTVFKYRKNNRGFESLAMTPNGKLYAIIQSPLLFPTQAIGDATMVHRILEIDLATNVTRVLVYLNDGVVGATAGPNQIRMSDWKIGDMAAINNNEFLVIEAATRGTTDLKYIYKINISGATAVTSHLYSGTSVEGLINAGGLSANGITPVSKTLFLDLKANSWPAALDKSEGLAIINDSTIVVGNDNDYGQSSPTANGIPTATGNLSHILKYGLKGNNKIAGYQASATSLVYGETGPSTAQSPYLLPATDDDAFTSILTAGDVIGSYKMAGLPDGLGAYDNNNGTFTILMNHEMNPGDGAVHAHGSKGAFVSKWVVNKTDLSVVSGSDLIQSVNLWNTTTSSYAPGTTAFNRFCSADLPEVSAFYNSATGLGTQERIFMNGEESGNEGRAFGHISTGVNAGVTYELPALGKMSWENSVASPKAGDKTVVAGLDDTGGGQVYIYVGSKTNTGTEVEKAGLTNGKLYGVVVSSYLLESNATIPAANTAFTLADLGDVRNTTGSAINTSSNNVGVTGFLRPEDGAWDPKNPNDFYFATTNNIGSPSRLWRLRFTDASNPESGGVITAVLDGTEGQEMMDNLTIDGYGHILLVEDVGGNPHIGKTWQYNIATDELKQVATHDETRFLIGGANFLTQDEEASGILDVEKILGPGYFLVVDQAHFGIPGDVVQGGQLLSFFNPDTYKASQLITDIHSSLAESNVNLYPNPTGGDATVSIRLEKSERVIISIVDLQGQEVMKAIDNSFDQGEQEIILPTATLSNGVYVVQVTSGTSITRIRTVVLH